MCIWNSWKLTLNLTFISGRPHVESFNFMLDEGLKFAVGDLKPVEFEIPSSSKFFFFGGGGLNN